MAKLKDKMIREMRLRNFSPRTQESYANAVKGLVSYYNKSPLEINQEEIEDYIFHMIDGRSLSWNTCNVAISGIKFFYNETLKEKGVELRVPKRKSLKRLPVVYSLKEIEKIMYALSNVKHRAMLMTTYSGGLRASETVGISPCHQKTNDC